LTSPSMMPSSICTVLYVWSACDDRNARPPSQDTHRESVALNALGSELLIGAPYRDDAQGAAWAVVGASTV